MTSGLSEWTVLTICAVVIVDREAAHSDPEVDKWNKMAVLALALPHPPTFFEPLRQRMAGYLDRLAPNRRQLGKAVASVPKVVYVNRQDNSRRLEAQAHADLLSLFKVMEARGQITFVHGIFGRRGYGVRDQMRVMLDADVRSFLRISQQRSYSVYEYKLTPARS